MAALGWLMILDFAGSPLALVLPQVPGPTDADLAVAFFASDRPPHASFIDGTPDPTEAQREGTRAMQGRPRRPALVEG